MSFYQVGGSLSRQHPYYVKRQADVDLYQGLSSGQFCYVFNARQMGKSSLMVQVFHQLQQDGVYCGAIDLSRIGSEMLTPEQWYKGLVVELWQAFDLCQMVNLKQWWNDRQDLSSVQRLGQFIEEVLLRQVVLENQIQPKLVLFLDEIESVRGLSFSVNDFFALIRACYNRRSLKPEYQRLTFALLGVATPADLMTDYRRTPFNIGRAIDLCEFQLAEAEPLAGGLAGCVTNPQLALQEILAWTGGQPFLTQKVSQLLVEHSASIPAPDDHSTEAATRSLIAHLIHKFIIQSWEFQDEPEHLRTIRDRLLSNPQLSGRLLGTYQQILDAGTGEAGDRGNATQAQSLHYSSSDFPSIPTVFNGSREQIELLLTGLVKNQQGQLVVKNPIYRSVFHADWVRQQLTQLRPYADRLDAWIANRQQDEAYLLRGQVLQDALTWALGKSLSDRDYQFLGASQEIAKREAQTALAAVNHASQILASARQQASQAVRKRRIRWQWIPGMTLGVTVSIVLLRTLGLLQGLEWDLFDQFFRWRPLEPPDRRIAIVTIDEADLRQFGYPIPDRTLAQAITTIHAQQPSAIGLDIYRDLPVEPGRADLLRVFQSTPNLFGIEKVIGDRVAPPPILDEKAQIGFADQVEDSDGKVRRGLLSVLVDNEAHYSLSVQLARHYLMAKGVTEQYLDQTGLRLQLGKATFAAFQPNDGSYIHAQADGYQLLLNFRGAETNFLTIPLRQIFKRPVALEQLRDRVVLIGMTAESVNDRFQTPYNGGLGGSAQRMNGVTLHANIVSQILSSALDGRPVFQVCSDPIEWLWILGWAIVGTLVSWRIRSSISQGICLVLLSGGLVIGCYFAFLQGWWLPIAPALLAMGSAAIVIVIVTTKQRDSLHLDRTLTLLLEARQNYPVAGQIAIEYLKQSETKENQTKIERQLEKSVDTPSSWGN